ncbi:hypothetical protein FHETE_2077 [Fusarium heterosporum]|uniref:Uncharacterized protein n=1 Tax=Fusarium heterosporum TaxID=42747 RepID=A0A8H5TUX1_FUSHE|nr:hypothetical protein FHETE_2077 [Fusarium heterosporum]
MVLSNPFDKLPAELSIMVLGLLESAEDILSLIRADPHMLQVFLQHELIILRPLRRSLYRQFPGRNLTQAVVACRLRQIERTPLSRNRANYQEVDYYCPEKPSSVYYIPWESAFGNKLRGLLNRVNDLIAADASGITSHDNLQFLVYLCSQGYHPLLYSREISSATLKKSIISLYKRYSQLKQDRRTCPLVVVADLNDSANALFAGSGAECDFWTSGAFMFGHKRLVQLDDVWYWKAVVYEDDASDDEFADESADEPMDESTDEYD